MVVRYPIPGITPQGFHHAVKGDLAWVWLVSHDGSVVFDLFGPRNIVDRRAPEAVHLQRDGTRGLIAPWRTIDQKGASQDGVTFVDALYDPAEIVLDVIAKGRDSIHLRKVLHHLIGSIDAIKTAELHVFSAQQGHWWAPVRWFKTPPDVFNIGAKRSHRFKLVLRNDGAFWRGENHVDMFGFTYESMVDPFSYMATGDGDALGDWPLHYTGTGGGYVQADGSKVVWVDDPEHEWSTATRSVVAGPFADFATDTDNQVVVMETGGSPEIASPDNATNDVWCRMGRNVDGTWDGNGVRFRVGWGICELSRWNGFGKTVMYSRPLLWPPQPTGEKWTLIPGAEGNPRLFRVLRNGVELLSHKEPGEGSCLGEDYRGVGWGMRAAGSIYTQATPAPVKRFSAGDNVEVSQEGYVRRINVGDQPIYDTYTCFGPGMFKFWLGPNVGANDYVEFGPLLPGQVVWLDSDPRKRAVRDLTSQPPTPTQLTEWQKILDGFLSFVGAGSQTPLVQALKSQWGIPAPQGNLYSLLKGRWNDGSGIPAMSPGDSVRDYYVKVAIDNGSAESKIIASGTPRRRYPL